MPKLRNAVPKYRKHRASGQAIVTIAGRDHYLGPHNSELSIAHYDRLISEFLAVGRSPERMGDPDAITVATLFLAFWDHASLYYLKDGVPTSELSAFKLVIQHVSRLYGPTAIIDFGPLALKASRQAWIQQELARSTINRNVRRVVGIFKWGVAEEMVRTDTWQALTAVEGLRKGRTTAAESVPVPPVDMDVVMATIPVLSPVVCSMIRLQMLAGMRPGEVCKIRPCDIDRTADVWEYHPVGHKTEHHDRSRVVYLGPQSQAILAPYLFRDPGLHCFSAAESAEWYRAEEAKARVTPLSCGNRRGRKSDRQPPKASRRLPRSHFDSGSYGKAIARACLKLWPAPPEVVVRGKEAVKDWDAKHRWSPNQLRHTRATEIRRQFGLEAAQVILGHASADVTQIYAERDAEKARDVVRQIG